MPNNFKQTAVRGEICLPTCHFARISWFQPETIQSEH